MSRGWLALDRFASILQQGVQHDMAKFWHRKTRTVVLAVLLVDKGDDEGYKLYHGTNMEVSMPTGSLCAERNVIGTALAADFGLRRTHLRMIAVLGLNLDEQVESLSRTNDAAPAPRSPVNNSAARPPTPRPTPSPAIFWPGVTSISIPPGTPRSCCLCIWKSQQTVNPGWRLASTPRRRCPRSP